MTQTDGHWKSVKHTLSLNSSMWVGYCDMTMAYFKTTHKANRISSGKNDVYLLFRGRTLTATLTDVILLNCSKLFLIYTCPADRCWDQNMFTKCHMNGWKSQRPLECSLQGEVTSIFPALFLKMFTVYIYFHWNKYRLVHQKIISDIPTYDIYRS